MSDSVTVLKDNMRSFGDLLKLARLPGSVVGHLSDKIKDDIDKGPIAEIREQYATRGGVEKEILKIQNS